MDNPFKRHAGGPPLQACCLWSCPDRTCCCASALHFCETCCSMWCNDTWIGWEECSVPAAAPDMRQGMNASLVVHRCGLYAMHCAISMSPTRPELQIRDMQGQQQMGMT